MDVDIYDMEKRISYFSNKLAGLIEPVIIEQNQKERPVLGYINNYC